MSDRITLTGMRFYGYHGCYAEETRLGQHFSVDVDLFLDLRTPGQTDRLSTTIHYGELYGIVKGIVEGPPSKLLEAVAEKIAAAILLHQMVVEVVVRVHKPSAPIPGPLDCVTVEIRRGRPT